MSVERRLSDYFEGSMPDIGKFWNDFEKATQFDNARVDKAGGYNYLEYYGYHLVYSQGKFDSLGDLKYYNAEIWVPYDNHYPGGIDTPSDLSQSIGEEYYVSIELGRLEPVSILYSFWYNDYDALDQSISVSDFPEQFSNGISSVKVCQSINDEVGNMVYGEVAFSNTDLADALEIKNEGDVFNLVFLEDKILVRDRNNVAKELLYEELDELGIYVNFSIDKKHAVLVIQMLNTRIEARLGLRLNTNFAESMLFDASPITDSNVKITNLPLYKMN